MHVLGAMLQSQVSLSFEKFYKTLQCCVLQTTKIEREKPSIF